MSGTVIKLVENGAVDSALRTIDVEQQGLSALLSALRGELAEPFRKAVEIIAGSVGRVIVTGVGKSGHIGSKIAATFASTGTPAFFVHPVEAVHGDLGMITSSDVILAISKSGEASELRGIVTYSRRFSIPLIAITTKKKSALGREADIVLLLPDEQEACPHGLAPTTSALLQLAIGDALAVALLEARGFTAGDFHKFHPGGKLGASLSHVADIMHTGDKVPLVRRGTPMQEAVTVLSHKRFGCVGVTDDEGRLCGIVTDGDIARNIGRTLGDLHVDDVMTHAPRTVQKTMLATAAMALLDKHRISALIVVDNDNMPVGIVHFHDFLRIGVA